MTIVLQSQLLLNCSLKLELINSGGLHSCRWGPEAPSNRSLHSPRTN